MGVEGVEASVGFEICWVVGGGGNEGGGKKEGWGKKEVKMGERYEREERTKMEDKGTVTTHEIRTDEWTHLDSSSPTPSKNTHNRIIPSALPSF